MNNLRYTPAHEWLRLDEDGSITLGITDYAQEQLGDIVYVEFPELNARYERGANIAVIESVKAVGEIDMPCAGSITAVNDRLSEEPEIMNAEPLGAGWLLRITAEDPASLSGFMDEDAYHNYVATL